MAPKGDSSTLESALFSGTGISESTLENHEQLAEIGGESNEPETSIDSMPAIANNVSREDSSTMILSELNGASNKVSPAPQSLHKRSRYTSSLDAPQGPAEAAEFVEDSGFFQQPLPPENEDEDDAYKTYQSDESAQYMSNTPAEQDLVEGQARQAAVNEKIQEMRKLKATIISEIKENTRLFSENLNQVLTTVRTQQDFTINHLEREFESLESRALQQAMIADETMADYEDLISH